MRNGAISSAITKVRSQEKHLALRAPTSIIKPNLRPQELQGDTWYDTRDCDELLAPADLYAATGYLDSRGCLLRHHGAHHLIQVISEK